MNSRIWLSHKNSKWQKPNELKEDEDPGIGRTAGRPSEWLQEQYHTSCHDPTEHVTVLYIPNNYKNKNKNKNKNKKQVGQMLCVERCFIRCV